MGLVGVVAHELLVMNGLHQLSGLSTTPCLHSTTSCPRSGDAVLRGRAGYFRKIGGGCRWRGIARLRRVQSPAKKNRQFQDWEAPCRSTPLKIKTTDEPP